MYHLKPVMNTQYIFELIGTGFFAISGALVANKKSRPDWFGVTIIGFITSLGGGSTRDVLLGSYPLVWVRDINFIYAVLIGIVLSSLFYIQLQKIPKIFFIFDTLGIAVFTILGTEKAMLFGVPPLVAAIMGMFSAVMGGVLRDTLTNEIPILFRKEIYATACLSGAFLYLLLHYFNFQREICFLVPSLYILVLRLLAIRLDWTLPKFRGYNVIGKIKNK
jgi:uncharacterized membrane protein YeiH